MNKIITLKKQKKKENKFLKKIFEISIHKIKKNKNQFEKKEKEKRWGKKKKE